MKELKLAWRYVRRHWWQYILGILALFIVDEVNTYVPRFTGEITNGLDQHTLDMGGVMGLVWKIVLIGVIIAVGRFAWRFFLFGSARSIEKELRSDLFAHLSTLSPHYYNEHKTGDLMARFINDLQAVRTLVGMNVISTFDATVMLLLVLWQMMTYVSPKLTGVAVLPLILIILGDYFYGKVMHKRFLAKQQAFSTLTDQVQETVSGIRVIKSFVQERKELYAFAKTTLFTKEKNLGVVRLQALVMPLLDLIVGIASLLTLAYGGYLAIYGEINIGQFISFNSYVTMLVWPMMAVGECITSVSQGLASLRRIQEIFDAKPEIVDGDMVDPSIQTLKGDIDIEHLSFAYPDQPTVPVLEDVSVHVKAGETLAVLGRTGSGKSTLPSLLMRLYDVPDGMITIDGHNLHEIPLAALRRNIACVPQDNFLFSDTLQNNIAFGSDNKSLEAVQEAAKNACIHDNIMEFPKQYQTLVGERGVTISGGQKQRSSIARALMKDAPILLLDDALSAVDTDTERQILDNLHRLRKGRTTIIVAHRISTIQDADHILVLDEGKVEEYGTHEELLNNGKLYASLYRKQQLEKELHEEGGAAHAE